MTVQRSRQFFGHSARQNAEAGFTLMEIILVLGIFSTTLLLVVNIFVGSAKLQQRTIVAQRLTADARYTLETMARSVRSGAIDYQFYNGESPYLDEALSLDTPTDPLHILATIDQDGNRTIFRRKSSLVSDPWGLGPNLADTIEVCLESSQCVLSSGDYINSSKDACNSDSDCTDENEFCQLSCRFPDAWNDITPEGVRLTGGNLHSDEPNGLKFVISPAEDPNALVSDGSAYLSDEQPTVTIMLMTKGVGTELQELKSTFLQTSVVSRLFRR